MKKLYRSLTILSISLFTALNILVLPAYAIDELRFSVHNPISGMSCININEPADPGPWSDNYLCAPLPIAGQIRWSYAGPIVNMRCTNINEPADPHTWTDNYLCVDNNFPAEFYWSYSGQRPGLKLVSFNEPGDPDTWSDNYLGWKLRSVPESQTQINAEILNKSIGSSVVNIGSSGCGGGGGCAEGVISLSFRAVQAIINKVGVARAGRVVATFGVMAEEIVNNISASDPKTIKNERERAERNSRLEKFDRGRYDRDGDYKAQMDRDTREIAREHGCLGC
jgi:hypothetical protein